MNELIIYHNGECSKSNGALEMLQAEHIPHHVRWYLAEPLSKEELASLLQKLELNAFDIVRKSEPLYKEQFEGREYSNDEWIAILAENPILIERPIVEKDGKAVVARPAEKLHTIL